MIKVFIPLLIGLAFGAIINAFFHGYNEYNWQQQALERGYGQLLVNTNNRSVYFQWKNAK
jgi:hypothetical protein